MQKKTLAAALTLTLAALAALPASAAPALSRGPGGLDAEFSTLAEQFPGFGGLYYDAEGRANVYLKDMSQASVFLTMSPDVQIHQADFDFRELQDWRLRARPDVLALPGVVTLDVDETLNRVVVGIDREAEPGLRRQVEEALAFALIPREAVVIEERDAIHQMATLRDQIRPIPGGVQIHFSNFLCTLGFNASRGGVAGFVTNSHCTNSQGGVKRATDYFQALSPAFIGVEAADPDYFRGGSCPRGAKCRFSDSAFAAYDSTGLSAGNVIAATTSCGQFSGSITISGSISVTGFASGNTPVGTTVTKIGRTTGCTTGPVDESCVDVGVSGSSFVLLCQDIVIAGVGGGDSGSPVLSGGGNATLRGILWGGNGAGTLFVYSPYSAVASELGLD